MQNPKKIAVLVACLVAISPLPAQILWNMDTAAASSGVPANLTVSSLTSVNGGGTTFSSTNASLGYTGASGGNNASVAAVTGALDLSSSTYFQFTLTPASGYTVSLTHLSVGTDSLLLSGPATVSFHSSADNYATSLGSTSGLGLATWSLANPASFTAVTGTAASPLTVRIYGYGGTVSLGTTNWAIDDLSATVSLSAIPEPSA